MKPISTHEQPMRPAGPSTSEKGSPLIGASAGSGRCQVRTGTDSPCGRPAATEVLGVLFCGRCAREQENYFAIGERTQVPRGRGAGATGPGHDTRMRRPQAPAGRRRRFRDTVVTGGGKVSSLMVVLVFSALASAACGGADQARGEPAATDPQAEQEKDAGERPQAAKVIAGGNGTGQDVVRADDTGVRAGGGAARADNAKAGKGDADARPGSPAVVGDVMEAVREGNVEKKDGPQKVTLRIKGDQGTRFSGACSVGGEERTLDGQTPERYAFELRDQKLECEVRKEGEGALEVVFADGEGARSVQRTDAGESTVGFTYSSSGISSSTSSVSMDRTVTSSGGSSSEGSP